LFLFSTVYKGYAQVEGLDFDEIFSPITKLEAIKMFLAFDNHKKFKVYEMDVKSSFLNGELIKEVYIEQPEGFQLSENIEGACMLKKALYGPKKTPKAWYSILDKYLLQCGFERGTLENNLYIKCDYENILIIAFYVDEIIFGSDVDSLSQAFVVDM